MEQRTLEDTVLLELQELRRATSGVTVETLARAATICRLLGAGDPFVTYNRLQHFLIDAGSDRTIRAAAASFGFTSEGDTHLNRLIGAESDLHVEQRQIRRLSDKGLATIARLIASNWAIESVPDLTAVIVSGASGFEVHLRTNKPLVVEMRDPVVDVLVGEDRSAPDLEWVRREKGELEVASSRRPLFVERTARATSVVIVWRGELWPKFTVSWHGVHNDAASESLGNKLMLRIVPGVRSNGW
jgi:hypothetical protein